MRMLMLDIDVIVLYIQCNILTYVIMQPKLDIRQVLCTKFNIESIVLT